MTDDEQKLDKLAVTLRDLLGDAVHITKSKPYFLEFTHPQATKGLALRALATYLGLQSSQVMAAGDSYNDLEMIEYLESE